MAPSLMFDRALNLKIWECGSKRYIDFGGLGIAVRQYRP